MSQYPVGLPLPVQASHRPKDRVMASDLPGKAAYVQRERDYSGSVDLEFFFTASQAETFHTWWRDDLAYGGKAFNAIWPSLRPGELVYQFASVPVFKHVYNGAYRVSATFEVRGASELVGLSCLLDEYFTCGPVGDPYWDRVPLLLKFDGEDGSSTFTDSSTSPKTVTRDGTVSALSSARAKFGSTSLRPATAVDSSLNQGLRVTASADFDFKTTDHTVECWAYMPSGGTFTKRLFNTRGDSAGQGYEFQTTPTGSPNSALAFTTSTTSSTVSSFNVPLDAWFHVAIVRHGETLRVYVDGALVSSASSVTGSINSGGHDIFIGKLITSGQWHGHIDELRITKGVARYTGNFTVPKAAFPVAARLPTSGTLLPIEAFKQSGTGSSLAVAGHKPGDLLVVVARRTDWSSVPGVPPGWESAGSFGSGTEGQAINIIFTRDIAGGITQLVASGATMLFGHVYRNALGVRNATVTSALGNAGSAVLAAKTVSNTYGSSMICCGLMFGGYPDPNPVGFTKIWDNVSPNLGGGLIRAWHWDTVGADFPETTLTFDTSYLMLTWCFEIQAGVAWDTLPRTVLLTHADEEVDTAVIHLPLTSDSFDIGYPPTTVAAYGTAPAYSAAGATWTIDNQNNSRAITTLQTDAKTKFVNSSSRFSISADMACTVNGAGVNGDTIRFLYTYSAGGDFGFAFTTWGSQLRLVYYATSDPWPYSHDTVGAYQAMPTAAKLKVVLDGSTVYWYVDDVLVRTKTGASISASGYSIGPVTGNGLGVVTLTLKDAKLSVPRLRDLSCHQEKTLSLTGAASIVTSHFRHGTGSIFVPNTGGNTENGVVVDNHMDFGFSTGDFTIELNAMRLANTYVGTLLFAAFGGEFSVTVGTDGLIDISYVSTSAVQLRTNVATFPLSVWQHVAVQRRGSVWETYLEGVLIDTVAVTGNTAAAVNSSGAWWYFGRRQFTNSQAWGGYLDEIRVTKGVARYTGNFAPATTPFCPES